MMVGCFWCSVTLTLVMRAVPKPPLYWLLEGTYLGHEGCSKASLILVAGGDAVQDAGARVVHLARPAASGAHVEDLREHLRVEAQSTIQ